MPSGPRREHPAVERDLVTSIYLDWNATTPPHEDVLAAMQAAARRAWGNPASVHSVGRQARAVVESLREAIAALVESHPRDVVLTSGGTEANNLALAGARALVVTRVEHPSVTQVAEALARRGIPVQWIAVGESGVVDPDAVRDALGRLPAGATVAVAAANHETGVVQPVAEVFEVVRGAGARLHVDAVQAVGKLDPDHYRRADSLAIAAHKIRGPKGIGALVWRGSPALLAPVLLGGAQERGLRPGTVDAVAAAGFAAALARTGEGPARYASLKRLRDELEQALEEWVDVNARDSNRLPHVSNLSVRGWSGDELVAALDLAGIQISSGSACSAGTAEPSPVLSAMLGQERARSSVRVSMGDATEAKEVQHAIAVMRRLLARQPSSA